MTSIDSLVKSETYKLIKYFLVRKVQENFKTSWCCLLLFFVVVLLMKIISMTRGFHDTHLNDIWLSPKQNTWIFISFDLNSVFKQTSEKVAHKPDRDNR